MLTLRIAVGAVVALCAAFAADDARSDTPRQVTPSGTGFQAVYGQIPPDQVEFISNANAIKSVGNLAPTAVWEVLEHGERVECLDCIPAVEPLLYDSNAVTREIAAWWLRRRMFGVFGPGEVYSRTVATLASDPSPVRRADAAYALGEFLESPGVAACAQALAHDQDPGVRAAAASALGRLNSDGGGALGAALTDSDTGVKLEALRSATRITSFSGLANIAALLADASADVRRRAIEVLDALDAKDSIAAVEAVAQKDTDATVRAEACHALGTFGDPSATALLTMLAASDPDTFVRDQAQIALRRV
jgi:hypothetical protein